MASTLGVQNPFRYRSYVYDNETGLYYLQSRYYDPQLGRFINADAFASTGQGLLGNNMFAYCQNNPVVYADYEGKFLCTAIGTIAGAISGGIWGIIEGKTGADLEASILSGAISGMISGFASDVLLVTGGSAGVVIGVMAAAGAIGSVAGNIVESKVTGKELDIEEVLVDATWDAGFGSLGGYMGGKMTSNLTTLSEYGFSYLADRMIEKETAEFTSNIAKEIVTNYGASAFRSSIEIMPQLFSGSIY